MSHLYHSRSCKHDCLTALFTVFFTFFSFSSIFAFSSGEKVSPTKRWWNASPAFFLSKNLFSAPVFITCHSAGILVHYVFPQVLQIASQRVGEDLCVFENLTLCALPPSELRKTINSKICKICLIFPNLLTLTPNSPTETEVASPARAEPQGAASATKDRRRRKNDLYPLDDDVRLRGLHCADTFISEHVI